MLAVVIVSWNVRELLRACLQSVQNELASLDHRVIVVDSASSDGTVSALQPCFPDVSFMSLSDNVGYVKANNLAMRTLGFETGVRPNAAPPEFVWLLNADTEVKPGCVAQLLDFMKVTDRCGLCTPRLVNPDGTLQHGSFKFPGLVQLFIDTTPRLARLRNTRLDGRYSEASYARGRPFQIGHPLGAGMLARGAAISQVGLLDEQFEMYCEEVDWAMRMSNKGWQRWCVPTARLMHVGGASSAQASGRAQELLWASRRRYYAKHYGWLKRTIALKLAGAAS